MMRVSYYIEGMHCTACIEKIKSALSPHLTIVDVTLYPPVLTIETNQLPDVNQLNALASADKQYSFHPVAHGNDDGQNDSEQKNLTSYYPIFLITAYVILIASVNNFHQTNMNWAGWMQDFMASFFLVFSAFKLLDIRGFATGYATYDLLAKRWYSYGYIYPFLELSLGVLYLTAFMPIVTNIATILLMSFSSLGVINSLVKKQSFQCACLGTFLKVPLSNITLIEDLTMVMMATASLMM